MNIEKSTSAYEEWLASWTPLLKADLGLKHERMAKELFPFFRATFYRWIQIWPDICTELAAAPRVLSIADLHVENFGTWRDREGRLIWGLNDFDESCPLAYTQDLVRLATSIYIAIQDNHLAIDGRAACGAILKGYQECLEGGGLAFVLEAQHAWLRQIALSELRDPAHFWQKLDECSPVKKDIPRRAKMGIRALMPDRGLELRIAHRVAGLGSLGRRRFVALADWHGARIAREAKALAPSACSWLKAAREGKELLYNRILDRSVRCPDPFVRVFGNWVVRRLAPDCSRIELGHLPRKRDEARLLRAMGYETANIHLGTRKGIRDVGHHLAKLRSGWLYDAAVKMSKAVTADWKDWGRAYRRSRTAAA
jgi:hypothetical protein